jgi:hypothetical protein
MNTQLAVIGAWLVSLSIITAVPIASAATSDGDPDGVSWETDLPAGGGTLRIGAELERVTGDAAARPAMRPRTIVEVSFVPRCKVGGSAILAATASCEPVPCPVSSGREGQWMYRMTQPVDTLTGRPGALHRGAETCIPKPGAPRVDLETLVLREFRSLRLPALKVRSTPKGRTFVHLPTTFFVERPTKQRDLGTILGHRVTVEIRPVSYRWSFGDGTVRTTSGRGGQGPDASVRHSYAQHGTVEVFARTTYRARYRVDGGKPRDVPGTVPVDGPATTLPVEQAAAQLVDGPR